MVHLHFIGQYTGMVAYERLFVTRFLTLAHEIAHNLIESHDSEHEFWFSAICETYMDAFSQLLGPPLISA